jgi:predicted amidophosphoribosyltransferase
MLLRKDRLDRERHTIRAMMEIYCRAHHQPEDELCPECRELLAYAMQRIDKCTFRTDKPTCAKCPIHCYKPIMREKVRRVMRYAGPRMMLFHPFLSILHSIDGMTTARRQKARVKGKG